MKDLNNLFFQELKRARGEDMPNDDWILSRRRIGSEKITFDTLSKRLAITKAFLAALEYSSPTMRSVELSEASQEGQHDENQTQSHRAKKPRSAPCPKSALKLETDSSFVEGLAKHLVFQGDASIAIELCAATYQHILWEVVFPCLVLLLRPNHSSELSHYWQKKADLQLSTDVLPDDEKQREGIEGFS